VRDDEQEPDVRMGLLGKRRPDCKTIADCRRDKGTARRQGCWELMLLCKALDRFGGELIAIDGGTCQAVNGKKRHFSGRKLGWLIAEIDADLQQLDRQDAEETPLRTPTAELMPQKLEQWQERKHRCQSYP
jgi:hypothetical protein